MKKLTSLLSPLMLGGTWGISVLCCVLALAGCDNLVDKSDGQDADTDPNVVKVDFSVNTGDNYGDILFVESLYDDVKEVGYDHEINTYESETPQLLIVSDDYYNLIMMSRGLHRKGQNVVIDARSTALALVTLHPIFLPVLGNDFQVATDHITSASSFPELVNQVQAVISERRSLTDVDNAELLVALNNTLDEVCEGLEDMDLSPTDATTRATVRNYSKYPLDIKLEYKTLTLRTTKQAPSYIGEAKNTHEVTRQFRVQGREDFGVTDLWEWTKNWYKTGSPSIYGEPTEVNLDGSGEYQVNLKMDTNEAWRRIIKNVLSAFIPVAHLDIYAEFVFNTYPGIFDLFLNRKVTTEELCSVILETLSIQYANAPDKTVDRGLKWAGEVTSEFFGHVASCFNVYGRLKNAANGGTNIAYFIKCPKEISLDLCVGETGSSDCTTVNLSAVSGSGQEGEPNQRLLLPITVKATSPNPEILGAPSPEEGIYVKFTTLYNKGTLSSTIVRTGMDGQASTYWTLGTGNYGETQYVRAVAVSSIDHNLEISEPVEFTAKLKEASDLTMRLDWHKLSGNTDLDLHVVDPYGVEIFWNNPHSYQSGGELDRDDRVGPGPEHIYFKNAPAGKYEVYVNYYDSETQAVTSYTVTSYSGHNTKTSKGSISYHQKVHIMTINFGNNSGNRSPSITWDVDDSEHWPIQTSYPKKPELKKQQAQRNEDSIK